MNFIEHSKVIVCLTTIESRIISVSNVINSLLSQTYTNFEIRLYISSEEYLLDNGIKKIPIELLKLEESNISFTIIYTKNIGPYRKLIPILEEISDDQQLIVTVDDDVHYPSNFLSTLVYAEKLFKCPVGFRGRRINIKNNEIMPYAKWSKQGQAGVSKLNVPTGKDGIIYRPCYFHSNILNIQSAMELAKTTDDLWFKWHTSYAGYASCLLFDSLAESFPSFDESNKVTLFDQYNEKDKNDLVIQALEKYFTKEFGSPMFSKLI